MSYTVKQTVVENLNADLDGKQPAGDYPTNASLTESLQSNLLNYTTNRILEIPQDIKWRTDLVETGKKRYRLTILKGSIYYVPQGFEADGVTRKFSKRTMIADNTCADGFWADDALYEEFVFLIFKDNTVILDSSARVGRNITSGETAPTTFLSNRALWYDTKNNYVKFTEDSGATWYNCSLPFLKGSPRNTIDETHPIAGWVNGPTQVFNGFGYIGSTVFALPGVKCQFADGRNEDGSYKSYLKTTDKILTKTFGAETFNGFDCSLACVNDTINDLVWHVNEDFDSESGYIKINNTEEIVKNLCPVFRFFINSSSDNGKISQFILNPVDKLNWKSTELSGMSMPSNKYIDLTLGASGATYTAPANGWFYLNGICTSAGSYGYISNTVTGMRYTNQTFTSNTTMAGYLPRKKGDVIICDYSNFTKQYFRFIYAQGDQ